MHIKISDLVNKYGLESILTIRGNDGITALPIKYTIADEGVFNEDEDVYDLLSQNSLHDLEQKHQTDSLDFFSLVVVDM